jgi:2-oxoglutarate ferredoxin oxidoreductase subunit alpha
MGQMIVDVKLAVNGLIPVYFYGRTGGVIFEPKEIISAVKSHLGGK